MSVIAVTELEYRKAEEVFTAARSKGLECRPAPFAENELVAAIAAMGARHAIVGVEPYRGPLYAALSKGTVLARFGVGHDGIDKRQATAAGLLVTNTPGALDDSVAELAISFIVAAARHIPTFTRQMREGQWKPQIGIELRGRKLALIGCGAIGARVARIAASGFGMQVVGCDPRDLDASRLKSECGVEKVVKDFAEAVADADFVSLHVPATAETKHLINAARLTQMPAKAWLVNTARGMVVDEAALFDALAAGKLGGAALDVFENEPYAPVTADRDLRTLANVIMTPHVGSSTTQACIRMAERALANITAAKRGDYAACDLVNPDVLNRLSQSS